MNKIRLIPNISVADQIIWGTYKNKNNWSIFYKLGQNPRRKEVTKEKRVLTSIRS